LQFRVSPGNTTTTRGDAVINHAVTTHGSADDAVRSFSELKGDGTRFIDARPEWRAVTQAALATHPSIRIILESVEETGPASLPDLVTTLADTGPSALAVFIDNAEEHIDTGAFRGTDGPESWVLESDAYRSVTISHVKTMLWHAGLLTAPGATTDVHDPESCQWALSPRIHDDVFPVLHSETPGNGGEGQ